MLNAKYYFQQDDDAPKRPDPSYDDLSSAQAKRYQRQLLEQNSLKRLNTALN